MTDQITDNGGGQDNAVNGNWYDEYAGDDQERIDQLSQFDSFDAFLEDYNSAKNYDWRAGIAGDDDKFKSTLDRYATPQDFGNAHRELNQKFRSGQMRPALPEDADEAQIKEFRRANNIPLEPGGYLENLPDGLVVGEEDKELMTDFVGALHEANADPAIAHAAIAWYNDFEERQQDAIAELDGEQKREAEDLLRNPEEGWGKDYRANMNLINGMLSTYMGKEAFDQLSNGRYQDGRGFFNDVNVLKGLASLARKVNDFAPLIEEDPDQLKSLHDEIAELEKLMGDRTSEYWKGPTAQTNQARLRELYDIRLNLKKDDAA